MGFFVIHRCKSCFTPSPSGTMCVAHAQVILSVIINILRESPVAVGHTRPVNVCSRTGTPAIFAAIIHKSPALGVIECTISGRSLFNTRTNFTNETRSLSGLTCRSICTPMVWTPSRSPNSLKSSSGLDNATTSYPSSFNSRRSPLQKMFSDMPMVAARIIFLPTDRLYNQFDVTQQRVVIVILQIDFHLVWINHLIVIFLRIFHLRQDFFFILIFQ